MNSKQKLSLALKECKAPDYMIKRAEEGYYSDFDSELELPCVQLVRDLESLGFKELSERARNGEFDATKQESDEWYRREGKSMMEEMGIDPDKMKGL